MYTLCPITSAPKTQINKQYNCSENYSDWHINKQAKILTKLMTMLLQI